MGRQQPKPSEPSPAAPTQAPQCVGLTQAQLDEVARIVTERLLEAAKPLVDDAVPRFAAEVVRLIDMPAVLERTHVLVGEPSRFMPLVDDAVPRFAAEVVRPIDMSAVLERTQEPFYVVRYCGLFRVGMETLSALDKFVLGEVYESAARFVADKCVVCNAPPQRGQIDDVYLELAEAFLADASARVKSPKQFLLKHSSYMSSLRWTP